MKLKELIRTHRPWPYPKNTKEKVEVAVTVMVVLLAALIAVAAAYRYQQAKVLGAADLRQTAASLKSFADAARSTLEAGKDGQLVGGFQKAHLTQLSRQVDSQVAGVMNHAAEGGARRPADDLAVYGGRLQRVLLRESDPSGKNSDTAGAVREVSDLEARFARLESEL